MTSTCLLKKNESLLSIKKKEKPQIILSSNEINAVGIIQSWMWEKGASKSLWEAVYESSKNYQKWYKKLYKVKIINVRLYNFRSHLLAILPSDYTLLINWFRHIQKERSWKQSFTGNLMDYVWRADNDWWKLQGYNYSERWCGDTDLWDKLMERVIK